MNSVANALVKWVESLPQTLAYYFPLNVLQETGGNSIKVGRSISIVDITESGLHDGLHVVDRDAYKTNKTGEAPDNLFVSSHRHYQRFVEKNEPVCFVAGLVVFGLGHFPVPLPQRNLWLMQFSAR